MPHWIYLSPHFDDAALSCGGLAWEQAREGDRVEVWTVCGGAPDPQQPFSAFAASLHARWQSGPEAVAVRQAEDITSCRTLGAAWRHFPLADCIYRTSSQGSHLYASEEALWAGLSPLEEPLVQALARTFRNEVPAGTRVVCPLTLGDHVDHQLVRTAAERSGIVSWYYADYPYASKPESRQRLLELHQNGWRPMFFPVGREGLSAWQAGIAAHASQLSTFWDSLTAMQLAMDQYWQAEGQGVVLWRPPSPDL